jgi:CRISPR/Cas system-associated protein Cas5 (RAMP superfamily)
MLPMLMIALSKDLKQIVDGELRDAYIHGFKSAAAEENAKVVKKSEKVSIDFDQADEDAIRALQSGKVQTNSYNELSMVLSTKLNVEINNAIVEGRSIPNTVSEMRKVINTETYKLTRIARTEIINVTNEGRLASYQKQEKIRKKPFNYTLVVASGLRTCDAHRELQSRIPAKGLPMDELIQLQQSVGASHGMTLRGNSLLHPNQRTVLMRVA